TLKTVRIFKDENLMSEIIIFINERELIISGFGDKIVFRSLDESF
ncbi:TPA: WD40 repeat domain-containing protein, partial [Campylobacter coli]